MNKGLIAGIIAAVVVVVILFAMMGNNLDEEVTPTTTEASLDVKELFDCEGKNKFLDDCWKKMQIVDKQPYYNLTGDDEMEIKFAFMNREATASTFSYTITSLRSVDFMREGCPAPTEADKWISGDISGTDISLEANETFVGEFTIKPDSSQSYTRCGYKYVLDLKRNGQFYEKTSLDITINS